MIAAAFSPPLRLSDTAISELQYAVDLFTRAQGAVEAELGRLRACGIEVRLGVADGISFGLLGLAYSATMCLPAAAPQGRTA